MTETLPRPDRAVANISMIPMIFQIRDGSQVFISSTKLLKINGESAFDVKVAATCCLALI